MTKINTDYFENIASGKDLSWRDISQPPQMQTQCLAAIVVLLAELVGEAHKANEFDFKSS